MNYCKDPVSSIKSEVCKLKVIETLEEMCTTLIYDSYNLNDEVKSEMINQIVLILLSTLESNREVLTMSKVSLNVNTEALWERLIQVYCSVMSIEDQYSNNTLEVYRKTKTTAKLMKKFVTEKQSTKQLDSPRKDNDKKNKKENKNKEKLETKSKKKNLRIYTKNLSDYSSICYEGINITILFKLLMSFGEIPTKTIERDYRMKLRNPHVTKLVKKTRKFFFEKIMSIEFINPKGVLETIYYQVPAIIRFYSKYSQDEFEETVDRKSANSKLSGLLDLVPLALYESKYFTKLSRTGFSVNLNLVRNFRYINFIWAFVVNLIMLVFKDIDNEQTSHTAFRSWSNLSTVERILLFLTIFLAFSYAFTLGLWFLLQFSIEKYRIILDEKENHNNEAAFEFDFTPDILESAEALEMRNKKKKNLKDKERKKKEKKDGRKL